MNSNPEHPNSPENQQVVTPSPSLNHLSHHIDPDEINLLEYIYVLVKNKWVIIGITLAGLIIGYIAALIKGPEYIGEAVIAPRETGSESKTPNLSGFGMLGGVVASQLNLGENASLEKIDIILDSKKFNAEMIEKYELLPYLFSDQWDKENKKWRAEFVHPNPLSAGRYLRSFLEKEISQNKTMILSISAKDSLTSIVFLNAYLEYLDIFIRESTQKEAKENRDYLEKQLIGVTDPLLRAKIQELIAKEVEKMMVVSKEAFRVIDPQFVEFSFKGKKLYPLVFAFVFFFISCLLAVLGHAFFSVDKTEIDRQFIAKIKSDLFNLPFSR